MQKNSVYVEFSVEVKDHEYALRGSRGEARMLVEIPIAIISTMDAGNLLSSLLPAAYQNYQLKQMEEALEKEKESEEE
jgi:hypothetical protein